MTNRNSLSVDFGNLNIKNLFKNFPGVLINGGGGRYKIILILFGVLCYFQRLKKKFLGGNIEKSPFTYWLNGRWFLQIVDREF